MKIFEPDKMSFNKLILLTTVSIVTILVFQGIWFYYFHKTYITDMSQKINSAFINAYIGEINIRMNQTDVSRLTDIPDERRFKVYPINFFLDVLNDNGKTISEKRLDSLFTSELEKQMISVNSICYSYPDSSNLVYSDFHGFGWNMVITEPLKTSYSSARYVQATVSVDNIHLFYSLNISFLAVILILIIVVISVSMQVKIIKRQKQISKVREDLIYAMIHDMKTPISTISMAGRTLHSGALDSNKELKEHYFNILNDEAMHLVALTDKILTIAKFEREQNIFNITAVDIRQTIENLVGIYKINSSKPIEFVLSFEHRSEIHADPEHFSEAVSNLIDNSIKYSGESVRIEISTKEKDGYIFISVRDNGYGISQGDKKRIFNKFERGRNAAKTAKGFGLGLNYVKNVVDSMGGDIQISSIERKFTEVTLIIPVNYDKSIIGRG